MKKISIIIIILLLGLCGSVGYIVYDKVFADKDVFIDEVIDGEGSSEVKITKKLSEKDVDTFIRKINDFNAYFYKKYPMDDISKITNAEALEFGESLVLKGIYTDGFVTGFSGEKLRQAVLSYFGSDYPLKLEDINCFAGDGVFYQYDSSNDSYSKVGQHGHGGEGSGRSKAYFQDGTYDEKTETYVIHVNVLSADSIGELGGPRVNFYDQFNFDNKVYTTQEDTEYDVVYKEVSDKLSVITYTFVKNSDGGYGLKSVLFNS